MLEAISYGKTAAIDRGQTVKRNGRTTVYSGMSVRAELFILLLMFTTEQRWDEERPI